MKDRYKQLTARLEEAKKSPLFRMAAPVGDVVVISHELLGEIIRRIEELEKRSR